ncbi:glycosyltransferase [Algoriphagus aestuariicola]|uniref:Glycosyltransferase n=1 Tax=Algoriphagus aestuariicola TaxID=1852016 RepID=A0ABS3BVX3_9BACT|nr:glycosyltransferase [Algoriphagus aestuariicola]MBN7803225.1 glycosyltransferase [Algoriphagus aestuariicola]
MLTKKNFLKLLVGLALLTLLVFLYGFFKEVGVGHPVLFGLLTTALFFKILKVFFEWYHYTNISSPELRVTTAEQKPLRTVDMFTTACPGEPYEMFEQTLRAMVAVTYPHVSYLCDEGNDPALKRLCEELGVIHVTRSTHEHAKAGNVNNALKQAKGEICVILDPDHVPFPDFLDHVLHYFDDPKVGYVQIVQAYYNQAETFVARAAAEQTYMFYGPFMQAMGNFGTAQAIGANCTFRRAALDSIGGHAPGLTEDMHTSMLLHSKGWKSVYVPKILSEGLVPSSLSAYYKQQLKWSRGTFDLWINLFPKLFKKFTWRQNVHYGLMPVYYLFGLITVIDIAVPICSLLTGEYPWILNPIVFFLFYTPFLAMNLIVRLYAQNWLHGKHEKGIHVFGGLLRVGTWWVYTVGFIYTLLNIKVPYIPTPKEYTSRNEFLLGLPNLVVSAISLAAAIYGLNQDWQPYSFLMASFAISNAVIFFLAFAIGQTRWVFAVRNIWKNWKSAKPIASYDISYHKFSKIAAPVIIACLVVASSLLFTFSSSEVFSEETPDPREASVAEKQLGGFYSGIYIPSLESESDLRRIKESEKQAQHKWSIVSTYLSWGDGSLPENHWKAIVDHGAIPMITWEPFSNLFAQYKDHPDIAENRKVLHYIAEGYFDSYIDQMALSLRSLDSPVFLRFAHEMENPMYPWSSSGGNTPEDFKNAWRHVHYRFEALGVQNVSWVWSPWSAEGMGDYFPYGNGGSVSQYVDWIGLTALNYAKASQEKKSKSFEEIYLPFRNSITDLSLGELPVMLAEFGSTSFDEDGAAWNKRSFSGIITRYPEIKSAVLFYSNLDKNWVTDWRPNQEEKYIDWTFDLASVSSTLKEFDAPFEADERAENEVALPTHHKNITGSYGSFSWIVDGEPFFMKGICYNTGHDWQEGFYPLTKKQLEHDFRQIKESGANTIRRYEPGIYDRNIFNAAEKFDLKIMYGFWFDPEVDYYSDKKAVEDYENKVLGYVKKHKGQKSIVAWNIGNETWGLLKKYYAKPYLTLTRRAYLEFLENLAQKIHSIDPTRPVFSSEEHDHIRMLAAVHDFATYAPSIDVLGINSYYEQNLKVLKDVFSRFDTLRPYAVTEFGPKGYWSHEYGDYWNDSLLIELSSVSKADWYARQWTDYIEDNEGYNLGGFAFSWRDRYEGTATWFGITDYKGRLKPSYYYLQSAWKGTVLDHDIFPEISVVGHWNPVEPGQQIWMSAAVTNSYSGSLSYEWKVLNDKNWKNSSEIVNNVNNYQMVELKVPEDKSNYRVYVYATDSLGNVITASRPLLIR